MFGVNDVDLHVAIDVVYAYRRGRYFSLDTEIDT